ncbi:MAG: DsrE family protein [Flavobacteriaceae bacterium]|nr:DsrE family protein [Flavobacteriaceae bacterium]
MKTVLATLILGLIMIKPILAQKSDGPMVKGYGAVHDIPNQDFRLDTGQSYKLVLEVGRGFEDKAKTNKLFETAARFLNMHARNGFSPNQLKVALVIHGTATKDVLQNQYYKELFGVNNPNAGLFEALDKVGVDIYLCGQSSISRGVPKEKALPQVKMALSAMSVLIQLQNEGYRAIYF